MTGDKEMESTIQFYKRNAFRYKSVYFLIEVGYFSFL
jgi:hypothetical protein